MEEHKQDICTIRIAFPVKTDEQAIECKKKITEVLSDIDGVQLQFALMPSPRVPPLG